MFNSDLRDSSPHSDSIINSLRQLPSDSEEVRTRKARVQVKIRKTLSEKLRLQEVASVDIIETNDNGTPSTIVVSDASSLISQEESRRNNNGY